MNAHALRMECAQAIIRHEAGKPPGRERRNAWRTLPILTLVLAKGDTVMRVRGRVVQRNPEGNVVVFNRRQVERIIRRIDRAIALADLTDGTVASVWTSPIDD